MEAFTECALEGRAGRVDREVKPGPFQWTWFADVCSVEAI